MNLMQANQEWMSRPADQRFETLDALEAKVLSRRSLSVEHNVDVRSLHVETRPILLSNGEESGQRGLVFNSEIAPAVPTHWSFGQIARATGLSGDTLRKLSPEIVSDAVNYRLPKIEKPELKVMSIKDPEGELNTLQAITSRTYGRIWDAEVVAATKNIVGIAKENGKNFFNPKDWTGKPSGLYASDHDVFIFMVDGGSVVDVGWDQKGQRDLMHRGFIIWNSEVGSSSFGIMMFMFRVVCGNHLIHGGKNVSQLMIRHTEGGPARFASEAMPTLKGYLEASAGPIEATILKAKDYLLPLEQEELVRFFRSKGFTRGETLDAVNAAKLEEGDSRTLWQMLNGFTASARQYAHVDTRINLEKRAGQLLELVEA